MILKTMFLLKYKVYEIAIHVFLTRGSFFWVGSRDVIPYFFWYRLLKKYRIKFKKYGKIKKKNFKFD